MSFPLLNTPIDAYDKASGQWRVATVIEKKGNNIRLRFPDVLGCQLMCEWICIDDTQIANVHSHTARCDDLQCLPYARWPGAMTIHYWYSSIENKPYLIISTAALIYKYDIAKNAYIQFIDWDYYIQCEIDCHATFIDYTQDILFVLALRHSFIASIDLNTSKCKRRDIHISASTVSASVLFAATYQSYLCGHIAFITSQRISMNHPVLVYDIKQNELKTVRVESPQVDVLNFAQQITFVKSENMMLRFSVHKFNANMNKIETYTMGRKDRKWKIYTNDKDIKMHAFDFRAFGGAKCLNIYDTLILIICGNKIWFYDLLSDQWFESEKQLPFTVPYGSISYRSRNSVMLVTADDWVYCMAATKSRMDRSLIKKYHTRISLCDVIPMELNNLYVMNMYFQWIVAYIHQIKSLYSHLADFPKELTRLIATFYPAFLTP